MTDLAVVAVASLFAGLIDAIVGGGGLILVPALFSVVHAGDRKGSEAAPGQLDATSASSDGSTHVSA